MLYWAGLYVGRYVNHSCYHTHGKLSFNWCLMHPHMYTYSQHNIWSGKRRKQTPDTEEEEDALEIPTIHQLYSRSQHTWIALLKTIHFIQFWTWFMAGAWSVCCLFLYVTGKDGRFTSLFRISVLLFKVRASVPLMHCMLVLKGLQSRGAKSFTNFCNHARLNHLATALVARVQLWPTTRQYMRHWCEAPHTG